MLDIVNVRFIDPHSKSDRRHHDRVRGIHEPILDGSSLIIGHTSMVRASRKSGFAQLLRNHFGRALQRHVNNGWASWPISEAVQQKGHLLVGPARRYFQRQVWTIKTSVNKSVTVNGKLAADVLRDSRGRRRREREYSPNFEAGRQPRQFQIVRTEIVTPFRNTVRLVNHHERDLELA